jgi:hypothetical protein
MADAKTKQSNRKRVEQWRREVLELQAQALELVMADRKESNDKPPSEVALEVVQLTEDAFHLLWLGWTPELVFASATASLKEGRPVLACQPLKRIPGMPLGVIDEEVEAPVKLQAEASEVRVICEPEPEPEAEPEPIEALVEEPEEIEEEEPEPIEEPTPEVEPEPEPEPEPLPVVITEEQWEEPPAAEPPAEPEPEPPAPPPSDGWLKAQDLAEVLGCSWSSVTKHVREGLFDDHMRRPRPGEGRGKRFDPEACRIAVENRPDQRRRAGPKPLRITPDALAADPALLEQLEQMLASVRGES